MKVKDIIVSMGSHDGERRKMTDVAPHLEARQEIGEQRIAAIVAPYLHASYGIDGKEPDIKDRS